MLLTTGIGEVDDVAVFLEHVDLLNALDGLDVQLLESGLELLVIGAGVADDLLDLAAGSTLATMKLLVGSLCGRKGRFGDENVNVEGYVEGAGKDQIERMQKVQDRPIGWTSQVMRQLSSIAPNLGI